jgi:hypothetical protein
MAQDASDKQRFHERLHSSSASRFTAGAAEFLNLSQACERPPNSNSLAAAQVDRQKGHIDHVPELVAAKH